MTRPSTPLDLVSSPTMSARGTVNDDRRQRRRSLSVDEGVGGLREASVDQNSGGAAQGEAQQSSVAVLEEETPQTPEEAAAAKAAAQAAEDAALLAAAEASAAAEATAAKASITASKAEISGDSKEAAVVGASPATPELRPSSTVATPLPDKPPLEGKQTAVSAPSTPADGVNYALLTVPVGAVPGDVLEFQVRGVEGKFQVPLPVGVVPGKSRIQAQTPPGVLVSPGAVVDVVEVLHPPGSSKATEAAAATNQEASSSSSAAEVVGDISAKTPSSRSSDGDTSSTSSTSNGAAGVAGSTDKAPTWDPAAAAAAAAAAAGFPNPSPPLAPNLGSSSGAIRGSTSSGSSSSSSSSGNLGSVSKNSAGMSPAALAANSGVFTAPSIGSSIPGVDPYAHARAPIAKEVLALLATKKEGSTQQPRFAGAKGKLLLTTPNVLRARAGNLFGNVFDLNDHFLYIGEPCGPHWVAQRRAEWVATGGGSAASGGGSGASGRAQGAARSSPSSSNTPPDAWLQEQCGLLLSRLLSCRPTPQDVVELVAPSYAATRARNPPSHSGAGRLLNAALGPVVFDYLHPPPPPPPPPLSVEAAVPPLNSTGAAADSGSSSSSSAGSSGSAGSSSGGTGSGAEPSPPAAVEPKPNTEEAEEEEESVVGDIASRDTSTARRLQMQRQLLAAGGGGGGASSSGATTGVEPRSAEDLELVFRGLCQRRVVVVHERLFGMHAPSAGASLVHVDAHEETAVHLVCLGLRVFLIAFPALPTS